jgi:hypothetical protein
VRSFKGVIEKFKKRPSVGLSFPVVAPISFAGLESSVLGRARNSCDCSSAVTEPHPAVQVLGLDNGAELISQSSTRIAGTSDDCLVGSSKGTKAGQEVGSGCCVALASSSAVSVIGAVLGRLIILAGLTVLKILTRLAILT